MHTGIRTVLCGTTILAGLIIISDVADARQGGGDRAGISQSSVGKAAKRASHRPSGFRAKTQATSVRQPVRQAKRPGAGAFGRMPGLRPNLASSLRPNGGPNFRPNFASGHKPNFNPNPRPNFTPNQKPGGGWARPNTPNVVPAPTPMQVGLHIPSNTPLPPAANTPPPGGCTWVRIEDRILCKPAGGDATPAPRPGHHHAPGCTYMVINGELECRYPPPPNTVTPSPNGPAAAGGQTPPLHVPPAATIPLPTQAALGITPVQQKMDTLRDKLGLVPPQEARGPGAAPIPGGGQGSRNPGPNDQPPSELNCVGSALTGVKHPGDIAGLDRWERSHFGQGARSALDLLRMPGDRDVQHRATDIERNGDRPRTRIVETRWTDSAGVRHTFRETQQQARAWSRDGGKWVSTGSYESTSSGGPGGHGQTVYFDGSGQEQYRVQYGADGSRSGVSIDGGRTWGPYQDENEDGRPDNAPAESEPVDTGLPPPGRSASPSQPVDGAPDQRDYWCETGVTNPGERPKPAAAGGAIRDPGRGSLSGVIVQPNPPRTPEQLREMTCQPGPDGDACRTGGGGGPQQNPISRFAQPRVPSGPGAGGTPHVPGLERPGSGAVTPGIPKPGDPERGS